MHAPTSEDLALFHAVDRAGSFTGAARVLGVNQSTVSRRLQELEDRIGTALFVRTRDGAVPTDLGRAWREPARAQDRAVAAAREATAAVHDGAVGTVRLATPVVLADHVLLPAVPRLLDRHPGLRLDLLATPSVADLARLEADVAVRFRRPSGGDLVARRLMTLSLAAYAATSLVLEGDHRNWPWIGWADPAMSLGETAWLDAHGIEPRVAVLAPTSTLAAVRAGAGVGLLPRALGRAIPDLVEVQVPALEQTLDLWAVGHRAVRTIPRVDAVWAWLAETLTDPTASPNASRA